jgi:hypothetical protein
MRIFVFGYNRYDTMTTTKMLDACGLGYTFLCHTEQQKENFIAFGLVSEEKIIVTGAPYGLPNNRNWVLDNYVSEDEWVLFLVDDFKKITIYENYYSEKRVELPIETTNQSEFKFNREENMKGLLSICTETIMEADKQDIKLAGFAAYRNPLFRKNKWKYSGLVDGRCILIKKSFLRYDTKALMMDDYCFTALNLKNFGKVITNNWVLPECERYTEGGYGTKEERMSGKILEAKYLTETYPEYIRFAEKKDWVFGSHIQIISRAGKKEEVINDRQQTFF